MNQITVDQFNRYFAENYSYIQHEQSNKQIYEFLKRPNFQGLTMERTADLFSDYVLSQGLCDVQE